MSLLSPKERRQVYALFAALAFTGLVEAAGIASIGPFLAVITDPGVVILDGPIGRTYRYFGFDSPNAFAVALGAAVLISVIVRNVLTAATTLFALRFGGLRAYSLSARVLRRYLHQPYTFYLNRNTTSLAKNILAEASAFVNGLLLPGIQIVAQAVVVVSVVVLLMIVNAALALFVVGILGSGFAAVYLVSRKKLRQLGEEQVEANSLRFQATLEALQGIKELKVLRKEEPALNRFSAPSEAYAKATVMNAAIAQLPRYALETLAIGGMLVVILFLLVTQADIRQALPIMGMFAFATYRLMPALQQLFAGVTSIRFHTATLDLLVNDLSSEPDVAVDQRADATLIPFERQLELRDVSFWYPGAESPTLEHLTIRAARGEFVAIVGPTGSGKTTIVDLLVGLLRPDNGSLLIDETEITDDNLRAWQSLIGYVPQSIFLNDESLARNIAFGVAEHEIDLERVRQASAIAQLDGFVIESLPQGYATAVGDRGVRLSGGQKQRIGIARAIYRDPALLVLDEATSALDEATQNSILAGIRESDPRRTIIMVTHRLTTIRHCDRVLDIADGRIAANRHRPRSRGKRA